MSVLPRVAATVLIASLALLGGAATASAQPADDGDDTNVIHHETNVAAFGDMVLD
ncbi:hypothetical protein [Streptomyces silvensis]|uniref:hypothetical protein n=1 Tax=Streptomyces silvensis TaxID=1765722 RepID=UPI000B31FEA4|nr:hypothetical protein [Streptomyces silvensis]